METKPLPRALDQTKQIAQSEVITFFTLCQKSLDEHYDRRERITKISRDITALSKKLIFALHRLQTRSKHVVLREATEKKKEILEMFKSVAPDLDGPNYYRYSRSISPAIEEYIEAVTFMEYIREGKLLTKNACEKDFVEGNKTFLVITDENYVLGVADLTGELMRYAINSIGKGDHTLAMEVCRFLQGLIGEYETLYMSSRTPISKKMDTMRTSLQKVEAACYAMHVRGSEYPAEMYQDIIRVQQSRFETESEHLDE